MTGTTPSSTDGMSMTTAATRHEPERRIDELRRVAARLWPDRGDAMVACELTNVIAQLRRAETALRTLERANDSNNPRKGDAPSSFAFS